MKIGIVGLGKLGLPMALALAYRGGHHVVGHDVLPWAWQVTQGERSAPLERDLDELLARHAGVPVGDVDPRSGGLLEFGGPTAVVDHADLIFVAVQTPHPERFDGTTPMPEDRADFDYTALKHACATLAESMTRNPDRRFTLAVVSTVAPGTLDRDIAPILPPNVDLAYTPSFISLGTVIPDFCAPEFAIIGARSSRASELIMGAMHTVYPAGFFAMDYWRTMSLVSAELTKLASNAYQTTKITFGNEVARLADAVGADVDDVLGAIALGTRKLGAPTMRAGLGDGGPCRVRDLVVLDWSAGRHFNINGLFDALLWTREEHVSWLAHLIWGLERKTELPTIVLGKAYKPDVPLTYGSPALLLAHYLGCPAWDPFVDDDIIGSTVFNGPHIYVIGTAHQYFLDPSFIWPAGSVVVDPWGMIEPTQRDDITLVQPGRRPNLEG